MRITSRRIIRQTLILLLLLACIGEISAQAYPGYTLFGPHNSRYTYLIDMNKTIVKTWNHSRNGGYTAYLLKDGSVMRTAVSSGTSLNGGGAQGVVQRYDWNGNLTWEYTYATSTYRAHHDIEPMPNGNVLIIAWEVKTAAQSVQAGLNHSALLWPDHFIEVQPVGTNGGIIVWKWHFWDHLIQDYNPAKDNYGVVAEHPELLDINKGSTSGDWMHINGISYSPELDQIVISSHNLHELYVIDHSTTTEEAAGHTGGRWGRGGDILYRWGNPANYRAPGTQVFKVVHNACWIPKGLPGEGNIMAFNNRENQGTSMVVELVPPRDTAGNFIYTQGTAYGPASPVWSYTAPGFYSNHLGSNQRLPNGNTLMVESTTGNFVEVNQAGTVVWNWARGGEVVRALRYGFDYPGLRMYTQGSIAINEFLTVNTTIPDSSGETDPWIELYNNSNEELYLGGRYLSNDAVILTKWQFPINTIIPPGEYLIVWADGHTTQPGLHTNFSLSQTGGKLFLSNIDKTVIDTITYEAQAVNISMARIPNGTGAFTPSAPTFNALNQTVTPPPIVLISPLAVVINEILAQNDSITDPNGGRADYIELINRTDSVISLSGIYLSDEPSNPSKWSFPEGISIEPGGFLVVWADTSSPEHGLFISFSLPLEGGYLQLANNDSSLIDSMSFGMQSGHISYSRLPDGTGDFQFALPTPGTVNQGLPPANIYSSAVVTGWNLEQNYPNPFNPETIIPFSVPERSRVTLRLYDILGREVALLFDENYDAGNYAVRFNTSSLPGGLNSGMYICEMIAGNFRKSIKMSYLK